MLEKKLINLSDTELLEEFVSVTDKVCDEEYKRTKGARKITLKSYANLREEIVRRMNLHQKRE